MDANPIIHPERICTKCGLSKPLTKEFWVPCSPKQNKTGWQNYCRACINERARIREKARRQADPEAYRAKAREYYHKNQKRIRANSRRYLEENRERITANARAYRERNREKISAKQREYRLTHMEYFRDKARAFRAAHPERHRALARKYRKAHMAEVLVRNRRRRARERNAPGQITKADVDRQYKAQRGKCWYCLCDISKKYEIEHMVPLSRGGTNYANNIVLACSKCNRSKSDKLPHEWIGRLF